MLEAMYQMMNEAILQADPEMGDVLTRELDRQQSTLVLIPSENYASKAVLMASGCIMTNKYAEGSPGKRYYNGCELVDRAETLAIDRAKELFGCDHANVQPLTGALANMAAYDALLDEGDTVLAMELNHGGHLTHGHPLNFSGRWYNCIWYGVARDTEAIDHDELRSLAREHKPKLIVAGASAYPRIFHFERFREVADEVGAYLMADIAHIAGLIVAGEHPDPVPYCDIVTTTTHKTLRGPRAAIIMCREQHAQAIDRAVFPGIQSGPQMHVVAAKAVAFKEALSAEFKQYQHQIVLNAAALAQSIMDQGFRLVSGGTDNHLMLVDLSDKGITGRDAADWLEEAGICVNKNLIPFDTQSPIVTSGIRPGSPAVTTRGMKEPEMTLIGEYMARVLSAGDDAATIADVREKVRELCQQFPVYTDL
jgi:glycine hydroxymethyltransferase